MLSLSPFTPGPRLGCLGSDTWENRLSLGSPYILCLGHICQQMSALLRLGLWASWQSFTSMWHTPPNEGLPIVSILFASSKWRYRAFARRSDCWRKWTRTTKSYPNGISRGTREGSVCHLTLIPICWPCSQDWTCHGGKEAEHKLQEGDLPTFCRTQGAQYSVMDYIGKQSKKGWIYVYVGLPGGASGKEPTSQCRRHKRFQFDPWVGKIPWRTVWKPTPVFLPGGSLGQRSLAGYSPQGRKE